MIESPTNSADTNNARARRKAAGFTAIFVVLGVVAAVVMVSDTVAALPLELFYTVLLVNTYFSIRCFSAIIPRGNRRQQIVDVTLVALYVMLPASFGSTLWFMVFTLLLFVVATFKYILLLEIMAQRQLLRKKIMADGVGTVACLVVLGGVLAGYPLLATYLWLAVFIIANIYLLIINPLYRLPPDHNVSLPITKNSSRLPAQESDHSQSWDKSK